MNTTRSRVVAQTAMVALGQLLTSCGTASTQSAVSSGGSAAQGGMSGGGVSQTPGSAVSAERVPTCPDSSTHYLSEGKVPTGYCVWRFAENLGSPRGITRDSRGQLLVIESGKNSITLLYDDDGDSYSSATERLTIAQAAGLNHGIALANGFLYASSDTTVYRWPYDGTRKALGTPQTVVTGMPASGNHSTRTLLFDDQGNLYINVGSAANVDSNASRARIVRYPADIVQAGTGTWNNYEPFADGTRNEVGLRFDSQHRLWGVENGSDDLNRSDLGGDIHQDNPAEELNLFSAPGFYGYPYCWSEGTLPNPPGLGLGRQWSYLPGASGDGTHTDDWCRNPANVTPPVLGLQAHSAPLDLWFYTGGSFPNDIIGSLFVTYHGSWDRTPVTGYKLVRISFGPNGMPSNTVEDFLTASNPSQPDSWGHRPVALTQGTRGELYITSDESNVVIAIGHNGT